MLCFFAGGTGKGIFIFSVLEELIYEEVFSKVNYYVYGIPSE